jgi:hypothetical protein
MALELFQNQDTPDVPDEQVEATPEVDYAQKALLEHRQGQIQLEQQRKKLENALIARSAPKQENSLFDPVMLKIAQGFLAPTKTGSFGESAGYAAQGASEAMEQQKAERQKRDAQALQDLEAQFKLAQMKQSLSKDKLAQSFAENYAKPNATRTVAITLPDGTQGTKEEEYYDAKIDLNNAVKLGLLPYEKYLELVTKDKDKYKLLSDAEAKAAGFDINGGRKWKITNNGPELITGTAPKEPSFEQQMFEKDVANGFKGSYQEWKSQETPFQKAEIARWNKIDANKESGKLDNETIDGLADQALAGDKSVFVGLGRGDSGAHNIAALRKRINEKMKLNNMTGAQIAVKNAEFAGIVAAERTASVKGANIELGGGEFKEIAPLALEASSAVVRSGILPFGKAQIMFNEQVNNPELSAFATYNNGLINTYARAISPTGVPTVSDKDHARQLLLTAKNEEAYKATVEAMKKEIDAAQKSPGQVRSNLSKAILGNQPPAISKNDEDLIKKHLKKP